MRISTSAIALALPAAATMKLAGAAGLRIEARQGRLWLTEEGCLDDVFLRPGQCYRVRSGGRVVIEAEGDSVVALGPVLPAPDALPEGDGARSGGAGTSPAPSVDVAASTGEIAGKAELQLRQCCPPSTGRHTPVMNFASSLARKTAAMAMSQGSPILPIGQASSRACIIASVLAY